MEKIEQVQSFLKSLGLEDSDFEKLSKEEVEDFTPFVDKAKSGIKSLLLTDDTFIDEISKPFKDAPIGKEKQLKKEARKFFNLQIKEDDLTKMPLSEILAKGTETLRNADGTELANIKTAYSELLEENEKLKNEVLPSTVAEIENKYKAQMQEKELFEELIGVVSKHTQVARENISMYSETFQAYLEKQGYRLEMKTKPNIKIVDKQGLPAKNKDGGVLHLAEALTDFSQKMQVNVKPVGGVQTRPTPTNSSSRSLLDLMGRGFVAR